MQGIMAPQLGDTEETETGFVVGIVHTCEVECSKTATCEVWHCRGRVQTTRELWVRASAGRRKRRARRKRPSPGSRSGANTSRRDRSTVTCGRLEHPRRRPRCRSDSLRLGTRSGRPLSASPNMPVASDKNSIFSLYRMFHRQIRLLPTNYLRHVFYIRHASWTKCSSVDSSSGSSSVTTPELCSRRMTHKNASRSSNEYRTFVVSCRSRGIQ